MLKIRLSLLKNFIWTALSLSTSAKSQISKSVQERLSNYQSLELPTQPITSQRNTVSLGLWKGFPTLKMKQFLKPSNTLSPVFGYHYFFDRNWELGMLGGFIRYDAKEGIETPLHLLTFKFDSSYLFRVYHPFYAGIGTGLSFLFPSIEATLPLKKHPTETFEVGGHVHAKFIYVKENADRIVFEFMRIRGTRTFTLYSNATRVSYSFSI